MNQLLISSKRVTKYVIFIGTSNVTKSITLFVPF